MSTDTNVTGQSMVIDFVSMGAVIREWTGLDVVGHSGWTGLANVYRHVHGQMELQNLCRVLKCPISCPSLDVSNKRLWRIDRGHVQRQINEIVSWDN